MGQPAPPTDASWSLSVGLWKQNSVHVLIQHHFIQPLFTPLNTRNNTIQIIILLLTSPTPPHHLRTCENTEIYRVTYTGTRIISVFFMEIRLQIHMCLNMVFFSQMFPVLCTCINTPIFHPSHIHHLKPHNNTILVLLTSPLCWGPGMRAAMSSHPWRSPGMREVFRIQYTPWKIKHVPDYNLTKFNNY